jgi:hypothetical protein
MQVNYLATISGREKRQTLLRFQVFTVVTMKIADFWDVVPCSSRINRRFGGTYHLHLQGSSHLLTLVPRSRIFLPWRWRRYVPVKCRFIQELHGILQDEHWLLLWPQLLEIKIQILEGWIFYSKCGPFTISKFTKCKNIISGFHCITGLLYSRHNIKKQLQRCT